MKNFFHIFTPPPDAEMITDPDKVKSQYKYWRTRQLYSTFIGYAVFYFVRKNIPLALPVMENTLGISKASLGLFLTLHDLLYGVAKFLNGILGDRANPRYFMAVGLLLSAIMNILFGLSTGLYTMGVVWMLNGWFQGMGFPPCARILSHWFGQKERGTKWAIWNTSHQVGAAIILVFAGYLAKYYGWQSCFFVPAVISIAVAIFLAERLRDTPGSLGLPPVEVYTAPTDEEFLLRLRTGYLDVPFGKEETSEKKEPGKEEDEIPFKEFLMKYVFSNVYIWIICFANFFVYVIRYIFMNWAPTFLNEMRGISLVQAGGMTAGFEVAGLVGSLLAGWLTDRYFKSKRGPVCVIYMVFTVIAIFIFWKLPAGFPWLDTLMLFLIGFFIYGPQFLVGIMTVDIATKRAAATAIGLTGFFGYMSGIVSGWGLGWVVDHYGWDGGFFLLVLCSVIATLFFAFTWNVKGED